MPVQPTFRPNHDQVADFFAQDEVRRPDTAVHSAARHWKLVLVVVVVVTSLAGGFAAVQPKRYQTETIAAVSPIVGRLTPSELLQGIDALERRVVVSTVAALASSDIMRRRTIGARRGYEIDAAVVPSTNLVRITAEGPDPRQVATIANQIPPLLDAQTQAMYRVYTISTISAALVPHAPVRPRVDRAVIAGIAIGIVVGAAIAYLIDRRRSLRGHIAAPQ
jgi:capsular polysaccharide biosynthesis protein